MTAKGVGSLIFYDGLQQLIFKLWTEIPAETCRYLVESILTRLAECIRMKGNTSAKY